MYSQIQTFRSRQKEGIILFGLSAFCLTLSIIRVLLSGTYNYVFLNWNLFLAFVPWAVTTVWNLSSRLQNFKHSWVFVLPMWFLFFPNALYIITDLFHLKSVHTMPVWFDMTLILCFAWVGLLFGFYSLRDVHRWMKNQLGSLKSHLATIVILFGAGYGVYVGRYLRYNSWDLFHHPFSLFADLVDPVLNPFDHPRTWGMTIFFGLLMNLMYWTMVLRARDESAFTPFGAMAVEEKERN